jgi:ParB family chromosome partitioning protein
MGRKNLLTDLIDATPEGSPTPPRDASPPEGRHIQPTLGTRGAVGAMSRSLEMLSAEHDAAKSINAKLANGQAVVEIDPTLIDASIVPDRMQGPDEDHAALVESIRTNGQLVPILLRPHPRDPSRFQTAYGHRRVRALTELGRPARAVVKQMTDDELVVAQGKENGERTDLSFIERSVYAIALEDRGFRRETIMTALSVDKTELSRLISVGRAIPAKIINSIGPAPKTGRRRWMDLEERLKGRDLDAILAPLLSTTRFAAARSDERFGMVFSILAPNATKRATVIWTADDGKKVASIERRQGRVTLGLNENVAPAFGDFLIERLPELYRSFTEGQKARGD